MRNKVWYKRGIFSTVTLLWMRLIFGFSAETAEQSSGLSARVCRLIAGFFVRGFEAMSPAKREAIISDMQLFVRKGAHLTEYAVLGVLLLLTLTAWGLKRIFAWAMASGTLYAALDELHQSYVPGRSGEIRDVLIDVSGLLLGLAAVRAAGRLIQMIKKKDNEKEGRQSFM